MHLAERAAALGPDIRGYSPEIVAAAVSHYLEGASVNAAARAVRVPEPRLRRWIEALGVKRSEAEVAARKRAARQAGLELLAADRREAARLRAEAAAALRRGDPVQR